MHPTRLLVWLLAVPAALAVAGVAWPWLLPGVLGIDALLVLLAAVDGVLAWITLRKLRATIEAPGTWSIGRPTAVEVHLDNLGRRQRRVTLVPDLPQVITVADGPQRIAIPGRTRASVAFRCTPTRRGSFATAGVHVAVPGPLGLWTRHGLLAAARDIPVYPDLRQIGDYELLARTNRLSLIGVRQARRAGGDTEFERLRDWAPGDPLSRVDWKATARREQLTARDYRTSQSQRLVILVDAGRMMVSETDGPGARSLLDHAIDAALMLAWVAVRQGDQVGVLAYADGVKRWIKPAGGPRQVARLAHGLHDLHAERVESRHEEAFLHLAAHERKRSLVIVLTHVLDEVNADHLERHCHRLVGRHLPMAVLLQDHGLHDQLPERARLGAALAADPEALWRAGAAAGILNWRSAALERLRRHGCLTIDTPPERLTAGLVSGYLEVKARHLL